MIRPLRLSALRATLAVVILAGGCAKVIGIDPNEKRVQCVSDAECEPGLGCVNGSCGCVHDCGEAGASGGNESCEKTAPSPCLCDLADRPVKDLPRCTAACGPNGTCVLPPSCNGLLSKCGLDTGTNCCQSLPVPGGDFLRSCDDGCQFLCDDDHIYPARISTFSLDAFEVTVGRFRAFVFNYANATPAAGAGKNPNNPDDTGWDPRWDQFLPKTAEDLSEALGSTKDCEGPGEPMWTDESDAQENRPINCVTWYEAQAFCVWDGGRLPTQAEWNYAAAGGDEQRYYPWSKDMDDFGPEYAVYHTEENEPTEPDAVGAHPAGAGKWGHHDLSGNVSEWVWDQFDACYSTPDACDDCGATSDADIKVSRGGAFSDYQADIAVQARGGDAATAAKTTYGFRCARDLE